jgi:hypothetical protein
MINKIISLISPISLFLAYYFNACIAHNLYMTFYGYKNTFDKRIYVYKTGALAGSVIILIISLLFNTGYEKSVQFSMNYYHFAYIGLFYFSGGALMCYVLYKLFYVVNRREDFFSYLNQNPSKSKKKLITLFVKRHIFFLAIFIACYLPNNIILLLQIFMDYKICTNCNMFTWVIYIMSLSCTFSFVIKFSEPYMQKYIKAVFNFVFRKYDEKVTEENQEDISNIFEENGNRKVSKQLSEEDRKDSEMDNFDGYQPPHNLKLVTKPSTNLNDMIDTFSLLNREMESVDFFARMIGITLAIEEDKTYDFDPQFSNKTKSYLPWDDESYNEKTPMKMYTNHNLPEWLCLGESSNLNFK